MRAVVVGGGLAGITAAIALAQAGAEVTLLEAKPRLGGATMSFSRDGLVIDTGQHVFLRCCTAYRGLLDRLGMAAHAPLQPRFDITVVAPGKRARMRRRRAPAPLHLLPALLGYPFLSFPERTRISRAALAFKRLNEADQKTDEIRLGDWLAAHGQDDRTRRVLWDLFSVSSLNVPGDDASLALAAVVVKTGLLGDAGAADIGVPALSLGELHGAAAARLLAKLGASVRLSTKVAAIEAKGADGFLIRLGRSPQPDPDGGAADGDQPEADAAAAEPGSGEILVADAVVLAVPHEQAARLVPHGALTAEAVDGWAGLGAAPIVNLHVRYDRKVMDVPFAAAVDSPVQWVFDRTRISGMHARGDDGQYLAVSLSAADEYVNMSVAELRETFVPALAELFPEARAATVTEFFVTRERRATFRQVPGTARLRPKAATALPGLVLAGAWTDTGWPDTMEGAVRSGLNAVIALHDHLEAAVTPASRPAATPSGPAAGASRVAAPGERAAASPAPGVETPNGPRGPQGPIERARGPQGYNASTSPSGTKAEISGFVPLRGTGSGASAVLEADPVFEANAAVEEETVSEVNVTDEDEREVRS
jgi:squalene-associated FAD-dependent desaturase